MIRIVLQDGSTYDVKEPTIFHWGRAEQFFKDGTSWVILRKQIRGQAYVCYLLLKAKKPTQKPFWQWFEDDFEDYIQLDDEGNPSELRPVDEDGNIIPLLNLIV